MRPCGHRWDIPLTEAAALYARMGYAVLPLEPGGKKPHRMLGETGGVHKATLSTWYIAMWWHSDPHANIGIATGEKSGIIVIDLDTKHADGREVFWRFLTQNQLGMGWNAAARTPSGGWHIWLRTHPGMPVARERQGILPGVDVKGDGGYVVAAPSALTVSDAAGEYPVRYSWEGRSCACAAPLAPPWMASWLAHAPATGSARMSSARLPDVSAAKTEGFTPGERNLSFYLMDCRLYGSAGVSDEADAQVIQDNADVWAVTDQSGMSWNEVERCRRSARDWIERAREGELTMAAALANWADKAVAETEWSGQAVSMNRKAKRGFFRGS